jgi:hypothetical protein
MESYKGLESFGSYCTKLMGEYNASMTGGNIKRLVEESTRIIFDLTKNGNLEFTKSFNGNIKTGKFYLIRYNYNGNKLWCPIFVIDDRYNAELQKRIIYAVNLDYLPYKYKIVYFDKLLGMFKSIILKNVKNNDSGGNVNNEPPLKVNFESVYKSLKANDFNYAITAFDYTKIVGLEKGSPEVYVVSTNILPRFIFINTKIVNKNIMIQAMKETDIEKEKLKLAQILELYEKTVEDYDNDVKEYYQKLKLIENQYKLYENAQ